MIVSAPETDSDPLVVDARLRDPWQRRQAEMRKLKWYSPSWLCCAPCRTVCLDVVYDRIRSREVMILAGLFYILGISSTILMGLGIPCKQERMITTPLCFTPEGGRLTLLTYNNFWFDALTANMLTYLLALPLVFLANSQWTSRIWLLPGLAACVSSALPFMYDFEYCSLNTLTGQEPPAGPPLPVYSPRLCMSEDKRVWWPPLINGTSYDACGVLAMQNCEDRCAANLYSDAQVNRTQAIVISALLFCLVFTCFREVARAFHESQLWHAPHLLCQRLIRYKLLVLHVLTRCRLPARYLFVGTTGRLMWWNVDLPGKGLSINDTRDEDHQLRWVDEAETSRLSKDGTEDIDGAQPHTKTPATIVEEDAAKPAEEVLWQYPARMLLGAALTVIALFLVESYTLLQLMGLRDSFSDPEFEATLTQVTWAAGLGAFVAGTTAVVSVWQTLGCFRVTALAIMHEQTQDDLRKLGHMSASLPLAYLDSVQLTTAGSFVTTWVVYLMFATYICWFLSSLLLCCVLIPFVRELIWELKWKLITIAIPRLINYLLPKLLNWYLVGREAHQIKRPYLFFCFDIGITISSGFAAVWTAVQALIMALLYLLVGMYRVDRPMLPYPYHLSDAGFSYYCAMLKAYQFKIKALSHMPHLRRSAH